jgi:uncharacterized protein (DUF952 family)
MPDQRRQPPIFRDRSGIREASHLQSVQSEARVPTTIYKICPAPLWRQAERDCRFGGAEADHKDGFIHFSTAAQVAETAAKHFAGAADLVLVAVDAGVLDGALKWEPSRGGDLFPHLYATLPLSAVLWVAPLPLGPDGRHVFPERMA